GIARREELAGAAGSARRRHVPRDLGAVRTNGIARAGVRAGGAGAASADPKLAVRVNLHVPQIRIGARHGVISSVRIKGAAAAARDQVLRDDASGDVDLTTRAREG